MTAVWWVRRDLRMDDNPALQAACAHGTVIPLYIHAPEEEGAAAPGAASRWWLHHSLMALDQGLRALGARLIVRAGRTEDVLSSVLQETGAEAVYWNRQYAPSQLARDAAIKAAVRARGVRVCSFNGALLFEPWDILRQGKPYRVFTPFWTACQSKGIEQTTLAASTRLPSLPEAWQGLPITDLGLLPGIPWDAGFPDAGLRVRPGPGDSLSGFSRMDWVTTRPRGTGLGKRVPRVFRHIFILASSVRARLFGPCSRTSAEPPMRMRFIFSANSAGGSLPTTCFTIFRTPLSSRSIHAGVPSPGRRLTKGCGVHGAPDRRGFRWSMPACANSGRPAGCTIGCG